MLVGDDFDCEEATCVSLTQLNTTDNMQLTKLTKLNITQHDLWNSTQIKHFDSIMHSNATHATCRSVPTSLKTKIGGWMQKKLFLSAKLSDTKHICNSFCRINQTNWLLANTLIGLTNCEIEEKPKETFQPGKEADFYPSVQMTKSRKSQGILWDIWGNGE